MEQGNWEKEEGASRAALTPFGIWRRHPERCLIYLTILFPLHSHMILNSFRQP
jgi:hypothetical protein